MNGLKGEDSKKLDKSELKIKRNPVQFDDVNRVKKRDHMFDSHMVMLNK